MATRKDYERTAAILNHHVKAQDNANPQAQSALRGVAAEFAAAFVIDNPRFQPARFLEASGFDKEI